MEQIYRRADINAGDRRDGQACPFRMYHGEQMRERKDEGRIFVYYRTHKNHLSFGSAQIKIIVECVNINCNGPYFGKGGGTGEW